MVTRIGKKCKRRKMTLEYENVKKQRDLFFNCHKDLTNKDIIRLKLRPDCFVFLQTDNPSRHVLPSTYDRGAVQQLQTDMFDSLSLGYPK